VQVGPEQVTVKLAAGGASIARVHEYGPNHALAASSHQYEQGSLL
jgi:hypothetical protein